MQVVRFECPHCSASLKIRESDLATKPVDCPECHKPIIVRIDSNGTVVARKPEEPSAKPKKPVNTAAAPKDARRTPTAASPARAKSAVAPQQQEPAGKIATLAASRPLLLAAPLIGVAVVGLGVAAVVFWPRTRPVETAATQEPAPQPESKSKTVKPAVPAPPVNQATPVTTATTRLTRLGELLGQYRKGHGSFPAATMGGETLKPSERLSWLAEFTAGYLQPNGPAPVLNEPWNSARNDRFVRQQIHEFLNPSIETRVSPQKYPATHFVGVAGVGEDAADLPASDPRAGVFGNSRKTRLEDIHDGASNTLMVLGVTGDLGSWAAGGTATVRPLTREPYVNGPDGFGTGLPDRMMVLKADGSVAEMSSSTDPRIFRRMAAMSDGLPLDPKVPGEPGDRSRHPTEPPTPIASFPAGSSSSSAATQPAPASPKVATSQPQPNVPAAKVKPPVVAAHPPEPAPASKAPPVDVAAGLAQHIVRFEQTKPVPLQDVLTFLEELIGVPIRGNKHDIPDLDDLLQTPITVQLENTTVRQILKEVLSKAGLEFEVKPDGIHLHKLGAGKP
jgi:hypothetical protein